ncbi:RING-type domain-containing protein [Mycena sanguinolenta]|uniref:RING-type domain-containing protein n=1 Tax=Mycena sanguinolenta TaxID=230812 RepID=A0A8H6ZL31_9AGAR|nr:RING-type domain-containing protein [Mycena sanguinolenta]
MLHKRAFAPSTSAKSLQLSSAMDPAISSSNSYDLLIVTDATASMGGYLDALRSSIPEILALAKLSGVFLRIGVLAYKDYTDPADEIVAWSGWNSDNLPQFVQDLEPTGGGDFPEAAKTALIRGLQAVNKETKTLVLWYADAPPHHISVPSHENDVSEMKAFPPGAVDWVKLCHTARRRNCTVFSFTPNSMDIAHSAFYVLLSELTGGISISSTAGSKSSTLISRLTLGVILQWIGHGASDMDAILQDSGAVLLRYEQSPRTAKQKPRDEALGCAGYLPPCHRPGSGGIPLLPILSTPLDATTIPTATFAAQPFNLAQRFSDPLETGYHDLVYDSFTKIIRANVVCLTYNPIFGQLWRAICKDSSPRKTELVNLFSEFVGKVTDAVKKSALRQWLEESFDQTEEIEKIVSRAADNGPMVYLDLDAAVDLTRTQLLDVSRSCYSGVLKNIASVFTHLRLAESSATLAPLQRSLPLTLPPRDFFRILPHLIVPGTLYSARAATLTAIVSIITGVPFLQGPATVLLATAKGKWLDMKIPENISFECARFLLSAPAGVVLTNEEKKTYEAMQRYHLIELNLDAPLLVKVPWTPDKTRGPGDVKVQCRKCLVRRSITIMSHVHGDVCGFCVTGELSPVKVAARYPETMEGESCWVECSTRTCRAQYVLEDVAALKIRPRCYYCRNGISCPWLECSGCLNRIIVPPRFQTANYHRLYVCPACTNPTWADKSIVTVESNSRTLIAQNGIGWLGFTHKNIFDGKSAFKLMQAFGGNVFKATSNVCATLTLNNKAVHDLSSIIAQVDNRVGRGEVALSICALCFEEAPHTKLVPACGRTGCSQLVHEDCLHKWYGQNGPGKLLNAMQFACPFCRRTPTVKTLSRYNRDAIALGGLRDALDDRQFFYAWCVDCGFAKRAYERTACTEDGIPAITGFQCKDCTPLTQSVAEPENEFAIEHRRWKAKKGRSPT